MDQDPSISNQNATRVFSSHGHHRSKYFRSLRKVVQAIAVALLKIFSFFAFHKKSTASEARSDDESSDYLQKGAPENSSSWQTVRSKALIGSPETHHGILQRPLCGLTVNEKHLPYSSNKIVSAVIGDKGAMLETGDVKVVYPPGSLPVNTPVEMMVAFLPSDFKLDGRVSLSPQVTVGPYGDNVLARAIELHIPIDIAEGSTVVVKRSETCCTEPLAWEDMPSKDYELYDGRVIITTMGSTVYQAISGPEDVPRIEIKGNCLHFSLFQRDIHNGKLLQLQCAEEQSVCERPAGDMPNTAPFHLLGKVLIRVPPVTDLQINMCNRYNDQNTIRQLMSPYLALTTVNSLLDDTFFVHVVCSSAEKNEQFVREVSSSATSDVIELWQWEVQPGSKDECFGCGKLTIQAGVLHWDQAEKQKKTPGSTATPPVESIVFESKKNYLKALTFDFPWFKREPHNSAGQQHGSDHNRPDLDFVEVQMKSITHPDASGDYVEVAVRRSLLHVEEISEERIPYLPCQSTSGTVTDNGVTLIIGDVTATFPSCALLLHSRVSMMVRRIEPGFQLHGKLLSPQVTIGPHCKCSLNFPVKIVLPMKVVGTVVVLVTRTAAGCTPNWEVVAASQYVVHNDRVEVRTIHHSAYQAQCGRHETIIKPLFNYLYFSVSSMAWLPGTCTLCLRCSGDKEFCTDDHSLGSYKLCHCPGDALKIQAVCGDMLCFSMECEKESIKQTTTPWDNTLKLDHILDEQFNLAVGSCSNASRSYFIPVLSVIQSMFSRQPQSLTATTSRDPKQREHKELKFSWQIKCNTKDQSDGFAFLRVVSKSLSSVEGYNKESEKCPLCTQCNAMTEISGTSDRLNIKVQWPWGENLEVSQRSDPDASIATSPSSNSGQAAGEQDVCSASQKRKSREVHSDEEGCPKKRKTSAPMSNLPSATLVSSEDREWEEKKKEKLREIRNPLFLELADSHWPFGGEWRNIFKRLPDVNEESRSGYVSSSRRRPCAYPNPSPEIKRIHDTVRDGGSQSIDADCLQMALNGWVDHNGGEATVADLLYVLELVKCGSASRSFFCQYFNLPDI